MVNHVCKTIAWDMRLLADVLIATKIGPKIWPSTG